MARRRSSPVALGVGVSSIYDVECIRNGKVIWRENNHNLVVADGLNMILWATIKNGLPPTPQWYVGLIDNNAFTGFHYLDTMASHAGWHETVNYTEGTRYPYIPGVVANAYVDNAGSRATFTINANHIIRGAFLTSFSNKGGNTGVLYGEAQFSAPRGVAVSDILLVKLACQVTSS